MSQEAITEIDMDVFSRRIGPYFSWLESRIESGWQQNDSVQKDVLKETKYLATTMRARFILGVSKDDFAKEVLRTLELFELAMEAFPEECDEVESKLKHFCKGVSEELGQHYLPTEYRVAKTPDVQPVHTTVAPETPKVEKTMPVVEAAPKKVDVKPVKVAAAKPAVKAAPVAKPKIDQPAVHKPAEKIKKAAKPIKAKPAKKRKGFFLVRWVKGFIYGKD